MTDRQEALETFLAQSTWRGATRKVVAGDASNRRYDRLTAPDGTTAILMDAPPEKGEDVRPFIAIARFLLGHGLSAPQILEADEESGFLILEDLGDDLFASLMAQDPGLQAPLYRAATDALIHLHRAPAPDLPPCDAEWMTHMNRLIFDWYAQKAGEEDRAAFAAAFEPLAQSLEAAPRVVILRDYHAQNLLWLPKREGVARVGQLDFQDALLGHPAYDLVSILQDARRDVPEEIEAQMIAHYLNETDQREAEFRRAYAILGAQRNLCILGIFARLCLRDGKPGYIDMIPRVWGYVLRCLSHPDLEALRRIVLRALPEPTESHLADLKSRCAPRP